MRGDVKQMGKGNVCRITLENTGHTEALPSRSRDHQVQMQLSPGDISGKGNSLFKVVLPEQL